MFSATLGLTGAMHARGLERVLVRIVQAAKEAADERELVVEVVCAQPLGDDPRHPRRLLLESVEEPCVRAGVTPDTAPPEVSADGAGEGGSCSTWSEGWLASPWGGPWVLASVIWRGMNSKNGRGERSRTLPSDPRQMRPHTVQWETRAFPSATWGSQMPDTRRAPTIDMLFVYEL